MPRPASHACLLTLILGLLASPPAALAVRPSEELLPNTTKGYLSVYDVDLLEDQFNKTQMGQLAALEQMAPFVKDFRQQIRNKLNQAGANLGITIEDLDGVYGGEVALAVLQPGGDVKAHATVLIVDVTGKQKELDTLLGKIEKNQLGKGAVKLRGNLGATKLTIYEQPKQEGEAVGRRAYFIIEGNQLISTDDGLVLKDLHRHLTGDHDDTLAKLPAFAAIQEKCAAAAGDMTPHLRWFAEPFGFVEVNRAASTTPRKRGKDMLKILGSQGFKAIQGVGGFVNFADGTHDVLHRTLVYAPKTNTEDDSSKYTLAARMLQFPNVAGLEPPAWVPTNISTCLTFNWQMQDAFYYSKTLVNEIAGDDVFDDVIDSIRDDPSGPRVDLRKDLVAHLGTKALMLSDYVEPITPTSERMMFAMQVANPAEVKKTLDKAMESDPAARKTEVKGHVIWEIINEEDDVPELKIEGANNFGFGPGDDEEEKKQDDGEDGKPLLQNSAITVMHGHLMVATSIDLLKKIIDPPAGVAPLDKAADLIRVREHLTKLGSANDAFRFFTRTEDEYRVTYELLRQNRMPESESMFGKLLNQMLGSDEEGKVRPNEIDGSKLPPFTVARPYLGPAGLWATTIDDGWFVTGVVLPRPSEGIGAAKNNGAAVAGNE